ncbi:helix-turn-helix domain-containing protein [Bradyrhizobium uaiense]|uniref:helix-turn-helix domain-containing protein n=1 Tax=Bradyrhizobium uaiense TaxID=2594946 RepID=UPI0013D2D88A|nr:helix-turn-helix domain-containing protein [Bradyrhizobium uaiense]
MLGVDRSATGRIREAFGIEPMLAQVLGMLLAREFVTRDGLYTVLYEDRPECEWPDEKILDVQICKLRAQLKKRGHKISIVTKFGEGWSIPAVDKMKIRAAITRKPDADGLPAVTDAPPLAPAGAQGKSLKERRMAFLEGA